MCIYMIISGSYSCCVKYSHLHDIIIFDKANKILKICSDIIGLSTVNGICFYTKILQVGNFHLSKCRIGNKMGSDLELIPRQQLHKASNINKDLKLWSLTKHI